MATNNDPPRVAPPQLGAVEIKANKRPEMRKWLPRSVAALADLIYRENVEPTKTLAPLKLWKRLTSDADMESVWKKLLKKHTAKSDKPGEFVWPAVGFVNHQQVIRRFRQLHSSGRLPAEEELPANLKASIQDAAVSFVFYHAFGYALSPLSLISKEKGRTPGHKHWEAAHKLREAAAILNEDTQLADQVLRIVPLIELQALMLDERLQEHVHVYEGRDIAYTPELAEYICMPEQAAPQVSKNKQGDLNVRRYVVALAHHVWSAFHKHSPEMLATIATVALDTNVGKDQVREFLGRERKKRTKRIG